MLNSASHQSNYEILKTPQVPPGELIWIFYYFVNMHGTLGEVTKHGILARNDTALPIWYNSWVESTQNSVWPSDIQGISPTENAQGGVDATPWIFAFPSEFFENISHGYVFAVKESNRDNEKIYVYCMTLKKNVENNHVTLTVDLGTQGHTHFSYDLAYLRLYAYYWLNLGVDSNILNFYFQGQSS